MCSAEVLLEILHRYVAINWRDAIQPAFDLTGIIDTFHPVDRADVERAKTIVYGNRLSARDAHVATMERYGIPRIMSFDTGFDGYPGIERLYH